MPLKVLCDLTARGTHSRWQRQQDEAEAEARFQAKVPDGPIPLQPSMGCCTARAEARRRWRLSIKGKPREGYPSGSATRASTTSGVFPCRTRALRPRAARPVWPGSRRQGGGTYSGSEAYQGSGSSGSEAYQGGGNEAYQGGKTPPERPTAEKWVLAKQRAEEAMHRAATAVSAAAEWAALIELGEIELLLVHQMLVVSTAAMATEAPKAIDQLESSTNALEATIVQLEARILAALREVSDKLEAEEELLMDELEVAPTCASGGSR